MCYLCVEIQKQQMTIREVARAYRELVVEEEHEDELLSKIEENYNVTEFANELTSQEVSDE